MNGEEDDIKNLSTRIIPLINKNSIKKYYTVDIHNMKKNKKMKILHNNDNGENNNIYNKYFSNKNIFSKINISNFTNKQKTSNKSLYNIKNSLIATKRQKSNKSIKYSNSKLPSSKIIDKNNDLYAHNNDINSNNEKYLNLLEYKNYNNNSNDSRNPYNRNNKYFNNSFTNLKNNSINNSIYNYYYYNNNKNSNINSVEKNVLNKSDSFNKSSSYLFSLLLEKYNHLIMGKKKKSKIKINKNKTNYSPFFKLSKDDKISAKQIYKHYLLENLYDDNKNNGKTKTKKVINNFRYQKGHSGYDYHEIIFPKLKNIYGNNHNFICRLNEIKKNKMIAYKKDFNIKDYQNILLKLLKRKVSETYLSGMEKRFKVFNEKNYGMLIPKGRYIKLAEKLKAHLSFYSYDNLRRMDKNYNLYFNRKNNGRNDNIKELKSLFEKLKLKKNKSL